MYIFNYCMRLQSHNSNVHSSSSTHLDESILADKNHQGGVCALYDIIKGQYTYLKNMRTDTVSHSFIPKKQYISKITTKP